MTPRPENLLADSTAAVREIRIRAAESSLLAFAKLYLGSRFKLPWNSMHREISRDLAKSASSPVRLAVAAPDGYGKSSIISFAFILWTLAYRRHQCIVLGSSTRAGAGDLLGAVDQELRRNHRIRQDFPHLNDIARSSGASGSRASSPRLIMVPGIAKVTTIGPSSRLSEIGFEGSPPDLIVLDGFDAGPGATESDDARECTDPLDRYLTRQILHRFTESSVVVTGSLLEPRSLIDRLLAPERAAFWTQRFYPAVERYPEQFDLWFEWAASAEKDQAAGKAFLESNRARMLSGTDVLWPEHESFEKMMRLRAELGWEWFDTYRQGHPPGGSLRSGFSEKRIFEIGSSQAHVAVVDDAGYSRRIQEESSSPLCCISLSFSDNDADGRPVPQRVGESPGPIRF